MFARFDPEFIKGNDVRSKYLTGLSWPVFNNVCNMITPFMTKPRRKTTMPHRSQLLMVLARLRLNLPYEYLSHQTGIAQSSLNFIFRNVIDLMYWKLSFLIRPQDRETIRKSIPPVFKAKFPRLTSIIDCFEIFMERPRKLDARAEVYSNYKKHSTVKFLISCSPVGLINFISNAWGGRASDNEIVRESRYISPKYHLPGDQILADRGFTLVDDFAAACGAELIIPAFTKGKSQLSPKDVEVTRKIASVRIHIERIIGLLKNRHAILQGTLPLSLVKSLNNEANGSVVNIEKIVTVCAVLVNLSTGIVYGEK